MNNPINTLFQPLMIGRVTAKNRLALSSMSRHRSTLAGVPTALNVDFYRQRARAGLGAPLGFSVGARRCHGSRNIS